MEKRGAGFVSFWCSTVTWFDAIAAGALIALFLRGGTPNRSFLIRLLLGAGGLAVWLLTVRFMEALIYPDVAFYPLIVLGSSMILLSVLGSNLTNPILVYFGRMSYGLYVFHALALAISSLYFMNYGIRHALAGLGMTIMMGAVSFHCLERPFLALKKRFTYVSSGPQDLDKQLPLSVGYSTTDVSQ